MIADLLASWAAPAAAWIVTFAVHSTLLIGFAWVLTTWVKRLPDAVSELVWKVACLGAILTATVQLAYVDEPVTGHIAQMAAVLPPAFEDVEVPIGSAIHEPMAVLDLPVEDASREAVGTMAPRLRSLSGPQWIWLASLLLAVAGLVHASFSARSTRRLLRQRSALRDGPGPALLGRLCARLGYWRGLRLSHHRELRTPIAFGVWRPEICLPTRTFADLGERHQMSILAHELGHLIRRDPLWLRINGLLIALFPWQPLLRVVRRRTQMLAEFRSDAMAAEITGNLDAAGCLLEVATWVAAEKQPVRIAVTGMALRSSSLKQRMDRLLSGDVQGAFGRRRLWFAPLSATVLTIATTVLPGAGLQQGGLSEPRHAELATRVDESPVDLLAMLITQMDSEFESLQREVELLRMELSGSSDKPELDEMLTEFDTRLASLRRHRQLFLGVLEEWSGADRSAPDSKLTTIK